MITTPSSRWLFLGFALAIAASIDTAPLSAEKATKVPTPAGKGPAAKADPTDELVDFQFTMEPAEAVRGQIVQLTMTGTPKAGYHTFPITQCSEDPAQDPSGLNQLIFNATEGLQVLQPVMESEPEWVVEKSGGVYLEYKKPFTWKVDVLVLPDAKPGELRLSFTIKLQVCDENRCVRGQQMYEMEIHVGKAAPVAITPALAQRRKSPKPEIEIVRVPDKFRPKMSDVGKTPEPAVSQQPEPRAETRTVPSETVAVVGEVSFLKQLLLAMGAGFIMLFTPCVFPMIPVTVSFFLKQGEKQHNSPLVLATVYTGTIVVVLTLAVLLLGNLIITLANNVWLNLVMGSLLMVFALSLFGMFELELPHFLTQYTSAREGTGYLGAFFMALTFTINSFTCTGPFLGPLLAAVKELKMTRTEVATSALAYSVAFAAPFFVLAIFPRLLKSLPKSGGWLNAVKVVMGFVEVALALKFLSITDAGLFPGNPRFFNYDTVLCVYIALSVACGLYLLGFFRLPHDSVVEHIGVVRLLFACFFLGLAIYMSPLLNRKTPLGTVGEFLYSWLPLDSRELEPAESGGPPTARPAGTHLAWDRNYEAVWKKAKAEKKLIFVDFTGRNCTNCRDNENRVFPRREVRSELEKFVLAQLYTDGVPDPRLDKDESERQALRNRELQSNTFDDSSLPLYAIIDPAGADKPFTDDNKLTGKVKWQATGTIRDVAAFVDKLKKAHSSQVAAR